MSQTSTPNVTARPSVPAEIEKLHHADVAATLARDLDGLTALWDEDCALLQPGHDPVVGKAAYREFAKQSFGTMPNAKVVKYVPDFRDVQVAGNLAYEWGYFDLIFKPSEQADTQNFRAKFMRIMKQQPDGSWKFTRVMWMMD